MALIVTKEPTLFACDDFVTHLQPTKSWLHCGQRVVFYVVIDLLWNAIELLDLLLFFGLFCFTCCYRRCCVAVVVINQRLWWRQWQLWPCVRRIIRPRPNNKKPHTNNRTISSPRRWYFSSQRIALPDTNHLDATIGWQTPCVLWYRRY